MAVQRELFDLTLDLILKHSELEKLQEDVQKLELELGESTKSDQHSENCEETSTNSTVSCNNQETSEDARTNSSESFDVLKFEIESSFLEPNENNVTDFRIFVKFSNNSENVVTEKDLLSHFKMYGMVSDISFFDKGSYSIAFLTYSCLFKGMKHPATHSHNIKNTTLEVNKLNPSKYTSIATNKLLVNGTLQNLKDASLIKYFSKFGKINKITRQKANGPVTRFLVMEFYHNSTVDDICKESSVYLVDSHIVDVRKSRD